MREPNVRTWGRPYPVRSPVGTFVRTQDLELEAL